MVNNKLVDIAGLSRYHENLKSVLETKATATSLAEEATARAEEDNRLAAMIAGEAEQREGELADIKAAYTEAIGAAVDHTNELNAAMDARVDVLEGRDVYIAADVTSAINTAAADALADAKEYANGLNTAMDTRVKALEAIDHDKIAADAVAAVVAGAESDFDTLKEVADWINSDTTGAAALQATVSQHTESIAAIETALDDEVAARTDADAAITATVDANKTAIETALASEKAVRAEEDTRLAGLIDSEAETRMGEMASMKAAYIAADDEVRAYVDNKFVFATDDEIDALFA